MSATAADPDHSAPADKGRSKAPSLLACITCRKSHLKCDGKKPLCSRCRDRNSQCVWVDSKRGYREFRKFDQSKSSKTGKSPPETPNPNPTAKKTPANTADSAGMEGDDPGLGHTRALAYEEIFHPVEMSASPADLYQVSLQQAFDEGADTTMSSRSESTISMTRQIDRRVQQSSTVPKDLIELFYRSFYRPHPFLVPWKLYQQDRRFLPEPLISVVQYVASHYVTSPNTHISDADAQRILRDDVPEDGFKVQGLLLFAFSKYSRAEEDQGSLALDIAVELALRLGMNRESFAIQNGQNNPVLQETWRRTWWSLFALEALITTIGGQSHPFRLYSQYSDVALPGDDEAYNSLNPSAILRTLQDFRERAFAECPFPYSSFAYGVAAADILGSVLALSPDTFAVTDPQIEALDANISSFFLSLPLDKRDAISPDGSVDECLLWAHMVINWAAISLHRPRSSLTFIRNHYRTVCTRSEAAGLPALAYSSHTAKALRAANAIINLASLHRSMVFCTPTLMCGITAAATVHLPAYAIVDRPEQAAVIKERLQLGVAALGSLSEIWPRAAIAKTQVAHFAREILIKPNLYVDSTAIGPLPRISTEPLPQIECDAPFNNDLWMENLIQTEADEGLGVLIPGQTTYTGLLDT